MKAHLFTELSVGEKIKLKNGKLVQIIDIQSGEHGITYLVSHTDYKTHDGNEFFVRPTGIAGVVK